MYVSLQHILTCLIHLNLYALCFPPAMDYVSKNNPKLSWGHSLSHQVPFGHPWGYIIPSDVPHASYSDVSSSSKKNLTQLPSVMFILLMCFAVIREMTATWGSWKRKWRIQQSTNHTAFPSREPAGTSGWCEVDDCMVLETWLWSAPRACCAFTIHCLLSSPFPPPYPHPQRIEAVVSWLTEEQPSCSSANNVVSSLLKPCISSALPAQPNRGPGLLSNIPAPAGCRVPSVPRPCARDSERLRPTFRFFCLRLRETSMHGELGSLGWGVRVYDLAFSRNAQALLNSFGSLSSRCRDFVLVGFVWRGREGRVGAVILCGQWVTFPLTLLFDMLLFLDCFGLIYPCSWWWGSCTRNAWPSGGDTEALVRSVWPPGTMHNLMATPFSRSSPNCSSAGCGLVALVVLPLS